MVSSAVFEDFIQQLGNKYFQHLKHNWNLEQYVNENGQVVKWEPLDPDYEKRKKKIGDMSILVYTGELLNSFNIRSDSRGFEIWSDDPKALYHQKGTENIPARPMLYIDKNFIKNEFIHYMRQPDTDFRKWIINSLKN